MPTLNDETLFTTCLYTLYLSLPLTLLPLLFLPAPYGKHRRPNWGPSLPAPLSWFLMESPTLFLSLLLLPFGRHSLPPLPLLLFLLHYLNRTLLHPLRLLRSPKTTQMPISILTLGFAFNLLNTYIQTRSITHYAEPGTGFWAGVRVGVGVGVFAWGMAVNVGADMELIRLKGGGGYGVARGGWFEVVSCPNYMGEVAEWVGWAVVAWTPAGWGFALYTAANLVPRGVATDRWYRERFGAGYPGSRKAVLPYLL